MDGIKKDFSKSKQIKTKNTSGFRGFWVSAEILAIGGLSFFEKCVLGFLSDFKKDGCRMNNAMIAEKLGLTENSIKAVIKKLKQKGFIECTGEKRTERVISKKEQLESEV